MQKFLSALLLLAAPFALADSLAKKTYEGTADMPDGYAFMFLTQSVGEEFETSEANGVHFIQDMLNLSHDDEGRRKAAGFARPIVEASSGIKRDIERAEFGLLCDPIAETEEEAFRGLERLDEARLLVYEKHLLMTKRKMSQQNEEALEGLLYRIKLSSTVVEQDHRVAYKAHDINAISMVIGICDALRDSLRGNSP